MSQPFERGTLAALLGRIMVRCASVFFCVMPRLVAMAVGHGVALLWFYGLPIRRKLALAQVRAAFGDALTPRQSRRIVRRSFANLTLLAIEGLRYPLLTAKTSAQWVERENFHHMDALLARGRGVIAVSIHLGHFELLGTSQTVRGYPISAIFKDMRAQGAASFLSAQRRRLGLGEIPPRKSREQIVATLARNEIVAFLIDQHVAPHRSITCQFFGRMAATTFAPVRFSLLTGAPILPLFIVREGFFGRHRIIMLPEFVLENPKVDADYNLAHNTQRLNNLVEGWVRAYPDQWLWAHKRWKAQDEPQAYPPGVHLSTHV